MPFPTNRHRTSVRGRHRINRIEVKEPYGCRSGCNLRHRSGRNIMRWRQFWKLPGLAILTVAATAFAAEDPVPGVWDKFCLSIAQRRADFGEVNSGFETMTLDDAKRLMIELFPEIYPTPESGISDEEARAAMEDMKTQMRALPRVLSSFCDMNARHTLPMPDYEFPEHGELSVFGRYETPEAIAEYRNSPFPADKCPQPFLLLMGITGGGHDDRQAHVFCEIDGAFVLVATYAADRGDPPIWREIR